MKWTLVTDRKYNEMRDITIKSCMIAIGRRALSITSYFNKRLYYIFFLKKCVMKTHRTCIHNWTRSAYRQNECNTCIENIVVMNQIIGKIRVAPVDKEFLFLERLNLKTANLRSCYIFVQWNNLISVLVKLFYCHVT